MSNQPLPGAAPYDAPLAERLHAALEAKGPSYVPRTHHLIGKAPKYTNRLILQSSPYLLQHAHNPVNWYPWGDEAFEEARRTGRPVFLSIGYSTCHWCHVMEGESFEDEEIARFMNQHYVCIKVDREERPDIDAIYMTAVQALTGSGGWPMSVWLTPGREPFFGGTYFPPRDGARGARHGFLTVLGELAQTYANDPERVKKASEALSRAVREEMDAQATPAAGSPAISTKPIATTVAYFKQAFDDNYGGVRRAPKFPSNIPVRLLLRYHRRTGDAEALHMATLTLEKMAGGGMYDQIAGGFHRYSTDSRWLVPHFEKMLYDNALLAVAYAEAFQVTARADFARVVRETLDYVLREMTAPGGAFYSATDADSEGEEGKFFVWTEKEIARAAGRRRASLHALLRRHRGRKLRGDPGREHPQRRAPRRGRMGGAGAGARDAVRGARETRAAAARRQAARGVERPHDLGAGGGRADPRRAALRRGGGARRRLRARAHAAGGSAAAQLQGRRRVGVGVGALGFLDDYAFVAAGLFDLYEATFDVRWLREALATAEATERRFADAQRGGWYMTSDEHERLIAREKPAYDGAEPSGTSVALRNALRAYAFTGDERWRGIAEKALASLRPALESKPVAITEALLALDAFTDVSREVALVWPAGESAGVEPLQAVLRRTFLPNAVLAGAAEGDALAELAKLAPFAAEKVAQSRRATAYVCERGHCELPATDPEAFAGQLAKAPRGY